MKELQALKDSLTKLFGQIPSEIQEEMAALEAALSPKPEEPAPSAPEAA